MSLQLAAQHMASRGRGPDTTLVHMAPQEVAGLQALAKAHGGSLTLNPDTGLPEAGFLSSILPMVAGAFLGPAGLGLTAMQAGLAAGALGTVATGSLKKGLMAGLGAFGGAGLAGSVMGAGAGAAQQAAMAGVEPLTGAYVGGLEGVGVGSSQGINAMDALSDAATRGIGSSSANLGNLATTPDLFGPTAGEIGSAYGYTPPAGAIQAQQAVQAAAPQTITQAPELTYQGVLNEAAARVTPGTELYKAAGTSPFDTVKAGFSEIGKDPSKFMTKQNLQYGLAGFAPVMSDMMTPKQREIAEKEKLKPFEYSFDYGRVADPQAGYTGAATGERTYFNPIYTRTAAGGGLMDIGPVEAMSRGNQSQMAPAYAQGGVSDMAVNPYTGAETFAKGGISNLGDYSDGGRLLKGPGDGVSDSIPATIADKRPARLADGEFVVPARIVSELGNGSTEAGARKLYAMMARVQKARAKTTGKNKVAVNSRAENLLPA